MDLQTVPALAQAEQMLPSSSHVTDIDGATERAAVGSHMVSDWVASICPWICRVKESDAVCTEEIGPEQPGGDTPVRMPALCK
jgi:hypothetical protein